MDLLVSYIVLFIVFIPIVGDYVIKRRKKKTKTYFPSKEMD